MTQKQVHQITAVV